MRDQNTTMAKKITAGIIALMMLLIGLFSAFFIASEITHNCAEHHGTEHNCPICICIQQCQNALHGFDDGLTIELSSILPLLFILLLTVPVTTVLMQDTLVSQKIRMND